MLAVLQRSSAVQTDNPQRETPVWAVSSRQSWRRGACLCLPNTVWCTYVIKTERELYDVRGYAFTWLLLPIVSNCSNKLHFNAASRWVSRSSNDLKIVGITVVSFWSQASIFAGQMWSLANVLWRDALELWEVNLHREKKAGRDPLGYSSFHGNVWSSRPDGSSSNEVITPLRPANSLTTVVMNGFPSKHPKRMLTVLSYSISCDSLIKKSPKEKKTEN